jgi:hypothetical protein
MANVRRNRVKPQAEAPRGLRGGAVYIALTTLSETFLASPSSIIVLSR